MYMVQYKITVVNGLRLTVKCNWQIRVHTLTNFTFDIVQCYRERVLLSPMQYSYYFLLQFCVPCKIAQMPEICLHISVLCIVDGIIANNCWKCFRLVLKMMVSNVQLDFPIGLHCCLTIGTTCSRHQLYFRNSYMIISVVSIGHDSVLNGQ